MGRPPLGKVAMSNAERHRRYMARLRQRATAQPAPVPAPPPKPAPSVGDRAQAFGDAYNQALANRAITSEGDE